MRDDILKLENQLCFPLYAAAKKIISKYTPFLDELNLTYTQYITMMVMWQYAEVTVSELGRLLYLDSGTLTPLLKKLEEKGFIRRERSDADERKVIVRITENGSKLKEAAVEVPLKMRKCLPLSGDDAKTLYELLYKILIGEEKYE
ncbi:MAG: MarR family transcriptional regulator [Clostridiales bacterium]|jgi:DNA-binding MarR family transcriptional regulator|nr:MarR family transcriptional regulator [Clostridiales bacterium]